MGALEYWRRPRRHQRGPHEAAVLEVIRDLGLELNIIFNKGAVMVLPPRINKAAGLEAALAQLELWPQCCLCEGRRGPFSGFGVILWVPADLKATGMDRSSLTLAYRFSARFLSA